ncbi:SMC family ATPase [Paenibacillus alvei]
MKIDKIIYNNFRNYKGKQTFKLNKFITILYGDNGNGKSSFFDGIEWCLTGSISRFLDKKVPKEAIANKNIKTGEECFVEIHFPTFFLRRSFSLNETGFGNIDFSLLVKNEFGIYDKKANGESNVDSALRGIFEEHGKRYKDTKYKMGEIINKAYILSQDQVADFVTREKPSERYNALASIMGFERVLKIRKNLHMTFKSFNEVRASLISEVEDLNKRKHDLQNKLRNINNNPIIKFKKIFNYEPTNISDIQREIDITQSNLFDVRQEIKALEQLNITDADNVEDIDSVITEKREEISLNEKILKEILINENKLEEEKEHIQQTLIKLTNNNRIKIKYEEYNSSIQELSKKLVTLNIINEDVKSLTGKINHLLKINRKVEYSESNKEKYANAKSFVKNFDYLIAQKQNNLSKEKEVLVALSYQKEMLENELLKIDENSHINNLIESIEKIYKYVDNYNINDTCPVCLSNVGNNLNSRISENLRQLISESNERKDMVVVKFEEKATVEVQESLQKNSIQKLEYEIKNLETEYKVEEQNIRFMEGNELFSQYFNYNESQLLEIKRNNLQELNVYRNGLEIHEKIKNFEEKLKVIQIDSNFKNGDLKTIEERLSTLEEEMKVIKKQKVDMEEIISNIKNNTFKFEEVKNQLIKYFNKYNLTSVSQVKYTLDQKILKSEKSLEVLKSLLPILENKYYNQGINGEITLIDEEINKLNKKKEKALAKSNIIQDILLKLDSEYGEEATNFLNTNKSIIQTYYRYLNPSPSHFNNLYFEVNNNEELYIKIIEDIKDKDEAYQYFADANMVLSSGQLNVLALAIFIATNEAQNFSYFDFIAIDDPIQNMDDVNRFSICDVLGQLKRQLIFSTHDQEFLNLFLKKNEHQINKVSLYKLNADENKYNSLSLN